MKGENADIVSRLPDEDWTPKDTPEPGRDADGRDPDPDPDPTPGGGGGRLGVL